MRNAKSRVLNKVLKPGASVRPDGKAGGFTLVEVLVVVAILIVLVAALVGVSIVVQQQRDTALTRNCLDVLDAALAEFHEITGHYPVDEWKDDDLNDIIDDDPDGIRRLIDGAELISGSEPDSDELLYLQLSLLPQTREMISKLPSQLIVQPLSGATVEIGGEETPYLQSIVDAWHTEDDPRPLHYERDATNPDDVFPDLWSNGPDGDPGTDDDITNED